MKHLHIKIISEKMQTSFNPQIYLENPFVSEGVWYQVTDWLIEPFSSFEDDVNNVRFTISSHLRETTKNSI